MKRNTMVGMSAWYDAIEAKTNTNTKIGATDLSALINKSPKRLKQGATLGNKTATPIPKIIAIIKL